MQTSPDFQAASRNAAQTETVNEHRVLVIDDNEDMLNLVRQVLSRKGIPYFGESTIEGALKVWEQHKDHIDILITDVRMAVMPGDALAQKLAAEKPSLRIIFMTGDEDHPSGIANAVVIQKPFPFSLLLEAVIHARSQNSPAEKPQNPSQSPPRSN